MEKIDFGTREYWSFHIDSVLEALKNDKEKILDIIMDRCQCMDIRINLDYGNVPNYEITYSKCVLELLGANKK